MRSTRSGSLALAVVSLLLARTGAATGDARVLDENGRVLTVGSFSIGRADGGGTLRIPDTRLLSWELRDGNQLVAYDVVPGTEGDGLDISPALSRSPTTGEVLLVWSHQGDPLAARQIAALRFAFGIPDPTSFQVLASGAGNQADPVVIHDASGYAYVAWADEGADRAIQVLGIAPTGSFLGQDCISVGRSTRNSAPRLGIDAAGQLFAAFIGTDAASNASKLYVLAPFEQGGGVTHIPNPMIELGLQVSLPAPAGTGTSLPASTLPADIHLTVLGGTPLAWWTEVETDGSQLLRYAAQQDGHWSSAVIHTIDLSTGSAASVDEGLAMLEARFRRVVTRFASQPTDPSIPISPTLPGSFGGRRH